MAYCINGTDGAKKPETQVLFISNLIKHNDGEESQQTQGESCVQSERRGVCGDKGTKGKKRGRQVNLHFPLKVHSWLLIEYIKYWTGNSRRAAD